MASPQARSVVGRLLGEFQEEKRPSRAAPEMCSGFCRMEIARGLLRRHCCTLGTLGTAVERCASPQPYAAPSPRPLNPPPMLHLHACGPAEAALASRITQGSAGVTPSPGRAWGVDDVRLSIKYGCVRTPRRRWALGRASILPHRCRIGTGPVRPRSFVTNALLRAHASCTRATTHCSKCIVPGYMTLFGCAVQVELVDLACSTSHLPYGLLRDAYLKRCPAPLLLLALFMVSCVCLVSSRPRLPCPDPTSPTCPCPVSSCLVGGSTSTGSSCTVHSATYRSVYLNDLASPLLRLQMPI